MTKLCCYNRYQWFDLQHDRNRRSSICAAVCASWSWIVRRHCLDPIPSSWCARILPGEQKKKRKQKKERLGSYHTVMCVCERKFRRHGCEIHPKSAMRLWTHTHLHMTHDVRLSCTRNIRFRAPKTDDSDCVYVWAMCICLYGFFPSQHLPQNH